MQQNKLKIIQFHKYSYKMTTAFISPILQYLRQEQEEEEEDEKKKYKKEHERRKKNYSCKCTRAIK